MLVVCHFYSLDLYVVKQWHCQNITESAENE